MFRITPSTIILLIALAANLGYANAEAYRYYSEVTGSYITSGDFHGAGGSARVGLAHSGPHCFEAELSFYHMGATTNQQRLQQTALDDPELAWLEASIQTTQTIRVHADINEFPIFLNYRFQHRFESTGLGCYAGAGLGLNIMNVSYTSTIIENSNLLCTEGTCIPIQLDVVDPGEPSKDEHGWRVSPAAQVFAGVSYAITKQLSFIVGGKLMFSRPYSISNPTEGFGMMLQTQSVQKAIEAGLSYQF